MEQKKPAEIDKPFIKLIRAEFSEVEDLMMKAPNAFLLLTLIALRARRSIGECRYTKLRLGEALIGDYKACGLTRQKYRTTKRQLTDFGFATFRATTKGTVATLTDSSIYDINKSSANQQENQRPTNDQPTPNQRLTTKKNVKNVENGKNDKKEEYSEGFSEAWEQFGRTGTKSIAFRNWKKLNQAEKDEIKANISAYVSSKPDKQFRGHFSSWINPTYKKWQNEIHTANSTSTGNQPQNLDNI